MEDPVESIIYGPSTSNKIERWRRDLHERLERYFKKRVTQLLRGRDYDRYNQVDREILFYVYAPVIQREASLFVDYCNSHRIREQEKHELPTGIPNHMFSFPEAKCIKITCDHIAEPLSSILNECLL